MWGVGHAAVLVIKLLKYIHFDASIMSNISKSFIQSCILAGVPCTHRQCHGRQEAATYTGRGSLPTTLRFRDFERLGKLEHWSTWVPSRINTEHGTAKSFCPLTSMGLLHITTAICLIIFLLGVKLTSAYLKSQVISLQQCIAVASHWINI